MAQHAGGLPEATISRLPLYHRALLEAAELKELTVSSERIAELTGLNAAKIRKDLSHLGTYGTRGVGYNVEQLMHQIARELGLTEDWAIAIVGFGNLGQALANYKGFLERGFEVVAIFDADPSKEGMSTTGGAVVMPIDQLKAISSRKRIDIAIIATPASSAQEVADLVVAAGITSILNFAPQVLAVPEGVSVRKVDLSIELQILSFYKQRTRMKTAEG